MIRISGIKTYSEKEYPVMISNDVFSIDVSGLKEKGLLVLSGIFSSCNLIRDKDMIKDDADGMYYIAKFSVNDFIRKFINRNEKK